MQIAQVIFVAALAWLTIAIAPALAKSSDIQKTDEKLPSPVCHAYQRADDGSWKELPCAEVAPPPQPSHKHASGKIRQLGALKLISRRAIRLSLRHAQRRTQRGLR